MKVGQSSTGSVVIFAEEGTNSSQRAPWWFLIPLIVSMAAVAMLYYRQQVLLVPVPARPLTGAVVDSRRQVGFTWTRIPKTSANYHIQIAADRRFKRMMYETRVKDQHEIRQELLLATTGNRRRQANPLDTNYTVSNGVVKARSFGGSFRPGGDHARSMVVSRFGTSRREGPHLHRRW